MGLGSTAKKLQKVAEMAEDVYQRLNEVRDQVREMQNTVNDTRDRVDDLETESAEQRALLEAIAEDQGIDLDGVIAEVESDAADTTAAGDDSAAGADADADAATGTDESPSA